MAKPADFVVDNASGSAVRTDLNNIFDAISINNGFGSVPTQKYKYMWYADTATGKMSFYKANATDKLDFISLTDGSFFGPNGTVSNPSYTFSNSTNTGFFRSAANEIGTSCNAFNVATFKQTGVLVSGDLTIQHPTGANSDLNILAAGTGDDAVVDLIADATYTDYGLRLIRKDTANGASQILHRGTGSLELNTDEAAPIVLTTNSTERARLDATGIFMVGQTSLYDSTVYGGNGSGVIQCGGLVGNRPGISCTQNSASSTIAIGFQTTAAGAVGSITTAGSATAYNTSSDYRLKENIVSISDGITRIKTLKPSRFNFKIDSSKTVDGFLAHEVTAVPEAITGTKDQVDSDNNPVYQGIDQSKLVPLITAALQEAIAKIETLEAKVAVLEGS
jgi:hypothetical protein